MPTIDSCGSLLRLSPICLQKHSIHLAKVSTSDSNLLIAKLCSTWISFWRIQEQLSSTNNPTSFHILFSYPLVPHTSAPSSSKGIIHRDASFSAFASMIIPSSFTEVIKWCWLHLRWGASLVISWQGVPICMLVKLTNASLSWRNDRSFRLLSQRNVYQQFQRSRHLWKRPTCRPLDVFILYTVDFGSGVL
jgi:hypothetical protein